MRRLFRALDIDYDQWKALTRVTLKLDFRQMSFGQTSWGRDTKGAGLLVGQLIFYTMLGAMMAAAVWFVRDLFMAGTLVLTMALFIVGTTILLDHNSALTSPTDYPVLGFRPISSRTYFAARLANVLVYTTAITTVVCYLPLVTLFVRHGVAIGTAGVAAIYMASVSTALAVLLGYATMLRFVGPATLKRALSYVQLIMSFAVYGGYFVFAQFAEESALTSFTLQKTPAVMLFPPTWYASYLELADGRTGPAEWIPAAVTVVALAAMATGLGGRLSLDYSERLGALASSSQGTRQAAARRQTQPGRWFRRGEGRAMALLIRSQFRNDQRFRMAVLSILPLTLLYVFMGVREGAMSDPFEPVGREMSFVTMAVLLFPSMLKMAVTHSESFKASWIFFASPADRARVVRASMNVLAVFFLLPYLVFIAGVYAWFVPNLLHVVVHVALLGLISHLCLQLMVLLDPDLPFSKPPMKGRSSSTMFLLIFVVMGVLVFFQAVTTWIYGSVMTTVGAFAAIGLLGMLIDRLTRARIERQTAAMEFQG